MKKTSIYMTGAPRIEWIRYCEERSEKLQGYYGDAIPDRTYHLYKFSHGAIGAATAGDISDENWSLLKRAASVFSLAYSRFKDLAQARLDLKRLKEAKKKAEDALANLKSTQAQLIHAEKMASLGELTAGIAHEIQNPLNFVNNFSEVNRELIAEMREEIENGDLEEVKAIAGDIEQNEEKISHHGKRADEIVKGMLQHSRTSSGQKELTDLNALADEYLRLAYHGLRAKDKSLPGRQAGFNADFKIDLDDSLPLVKVIPQDIGRVLLNLINNAFYAVSVKTRHALSQPQALSQHEYKPLVTLTTLKLDNRIEISVKDNGNGIPADIKDKIFQPFFTTKPTGQGTGLGLSLSYDIIQAHGGDMQVETRKGQETTFIVTLPV
jgi:signal transduction histidine kinase